jgi:transposase-like protein
MSKEERVSAEEVLQDIRRQARRKYSAEAKIRIVPEGLRGEGCIATQRGFDPTRRAFTPILTK